VFKKSTPTAPIPPFEEVPGVLIGPPAPSATGPGVPPVPYIPQGPSVDTSAAAMPTAGGYGGGGFVGPPSADSSAIDEGSPEAAGVGGPKAGIPPAVLYVGLGLLAYSLILRPRRGR